jgi:hypothetical protein
LQKQRKGVILSSMVEETTTNEKVKLSEGFKHKWTEALRSGKYKEGSGAMYNPEDKSYDAVGVAYRVAGIDDKDIAWRAIPSGKHYRFLPRPLYQNYDFIKKISDFSDKGLSFKWIASYIDRNL